MKIIKYAIATGFMITCLPALAATDVDIRWECLNLTSGQQKQIRVLDNDWNNITSLIRPRLIRDQERFKHMLSHPEIPDTQIRDMHTYILVKQERLRNEAMENFLAKRKLLTPQQRVMLHQMFQSPNNYHTNCGR